MSRADCVRELEQYFVGEGVEMRCLQAELFEEFPPYEGTWFWATAMHHSLAWQKRIRDLLSHEPTWRKRPLRVNYNKTPCWHPWADTVRTALATNGKVYRDFRAAIAKGAPR